MRGPTVIRGPVLLPLDGRQALKRTDVLVAGGIIAAVGGVDTRGAEILELRGVLAPGWVDAHVHLDQSLLDRGVAPSADPRWRTWVETPSFLAGLGDQGRALAVRYGLAGARRHGTLVVGDASGAAELTFEGILVVPSVDARLGVDEQALEVALERAKLATPRPAPPSLYVGEAERTPAKYLEAAAALAKRHQLPLVAHVGTIPDPRAGLRRLERAGALGKELVIAHGTGGALRDPGLLRRLADAGASVVLTPGYEILSGAPLPEVERLITAGVNLGLGTESGATRLGHDIAEEARLLQRVLAGRTEHPASLALEAATRGGARALALKTGSIEVGQRADLVLYDLDVGPEDDHESVARRVLSHSPARIRKIWVGGALVHDGDPLQLREPVDPEATRRARERGYAQLANAARVPGARWHRLLDWLERPARQAEGWHQGRLPVVSADPRSE